MTEPEPALWELPTTSPARRPAVRQRSAQQGTAKRKSRRGGKVPAERNPIARVIVDVPLPHLDRPFDYQVSRELADTAVPGARVRVRFAGQLVDGFVLTRTENTEHKGKLAFLERVVSSEPVLTERLAELCRAVADRYGGTLIDVLRLAIPPRHAKAEAEATAKPSVRPAQEAGPGLAGWSGYPRAAAYAEAVRTGRSAHAVWQALPGEDWPARLAELVAAVPNDRGALIVVPDQRDLTRVHTACTALLGADGVVALSADLGPAERYRRWLAVSRGAARIVVGTRAAMFAPVDDPALLVVWDDGDDLHADPHMPYPQVRDVLMLRAHLQQANLLVGGFARTAEAQLLLETGWAHPIEPARSTLRERAPRVTPFGEDFDLARDKAAQIARLPSVAFEAARAALATGRPVLVQVPRRGYVPALACARCRTPARCRRCAGPLAMRAGGSAQCRWCGVTETGFRCTACGSGQLRAVVVGAKRTAEELGRAFPGTAVRTSGGAEVHAEVPAEPALVVSTPGAEPIVAGGYGAALLLDGWALLGRQDLRAAEEALRRWLAAAALVCPAAAGGRVIVGADAAVPVVQALVRWDPGWHAARELAERTELGFPPAVRMASIEGTPDAVAALLTEAELPDSAEQLGPVPVGPADIDGRTERERMLLRVPRSAGKELAAALHTASARRNARKEPDPVRVQLDPLELI